MGNFTIGNPSMISRKRFCCEISAWGVSFGLDELQLRRAMTSTGIMSFINEAWNEANDLGSKREVSQGGEFISRRLTEKKEIRGEYKFT
jgi:hypothetical protein